MTEDQSTGPYVYPMKSSLTKSKLNARDVELADFVERRAALLARAATILVKPWRRASLS